MFDRWLGRISGLVGIWPLVPAGVIGIILSYCASSVKAIAATGLFGTGSVFLVATLIASSSIYLAALAWRRIGQAAAERKWSRDVNSVNPMQPVFDMVRVKLSDIAHPLSQRIAGKRFTNCDLLGGANVALVGCQVMNAVFDGCDVVVLRDDKPTQVNNTIIMEDCVIVGCRFSRVTLLFPKNLYVEIAPGIGGEALNVISYAPR